MAASKLSDYFLSRSCRYQHHDFRPFLLAQMLQEEAEKGMIYQIYTKDSVRRHITLVGISCDMFKFVSVTPEDEEQESFLRLKIWKKKYTVCGVLMKDGTFLNIGTETVEAFLMSQAKENVVCDRENIFHLHQPIPQQRHQTNHSHPHLQ